MSLSPKKVLLCVSSVKKAVPVQVCLLTFCASKLFRAAFHVEVLLAFVVALFH